MSHTALSNWMNTPVIGTAATESLGHKIPGCPVKVQYSSHDSIYKEHLQRKLKGYGNQKMKTLNKFAQVCTDILNGKV